MEASKRKKALRNSTAITVQTSKAVAVQRVIAELISLARWQRVARSARSVARCSALAPSSLSSNKRARSNHWPQTAFITASIAPIPESRKTGATAN